MARLAHAAHTLPAFSQLAPESSRSPAPATPRGARADAALGPSPPSRSSASGAEAAGVTQQQQQRIASPPVDMPGFSGGASAGEAVVASAPAAPGDLPVVEDAAGAEMSHSSHGSLQLWMDSASVMDMADEERSGTTHSGAAAGGPRAIGGAARHPRSGRRPAAGAARRTFRASDASRDSVPEEPSCASEPFLPMDAD
jgi:hypothetical protein